MKIELTVDELKTIKCYLGDGKKKHFPEWPSVTALRNKLNCIIQAAEVEIGEKYITKE